MSMLIITTPFNIDLNFTIAPFHKRLLAWFIDIVLCLTYVFLVLRYIIYPLNLAGTTNEVVIILAVVIPTYFYHFLTELFFDGRSVGKMVTKLKVIDMTGKQASLSQYLLRWLFRLFDMLATFGMSAIISSALNKHNQRIGDLIAGTVVIDTNQKTNLTDTIFLDDFDENYQPVFSSVLQLNDRDINGIRNLLASRKRFKKEDKYTQEVVARIKANLKIKTELSTNEFLEQLLKDYNFYFRMRK